MGVKGGRHWVACVPTHPYLAVAQPVDSPSLPGSPLPLPWLQPLTCSAYSNVNHGAFPPSLFTLPPHPRGVTCWAQMYVVHRSIYLC